MTDYKLEIEEARTLFWEKMSELVIEYELYNFDPNIKEMERDLMEAYDKSAQALTHLIETEKKKARIEELERFVGGGQFRKPDDELDRGIQIGYDTMKAEITDRLKELQGEV